MRQELGRSQQGWGSGTWGRGDVANGRGLDPRAHGYLVSTHWCHLGHQSEWTYVLVGVEMEGVGKQINEIFIDHHKCHEENRVRNVTTC